MDLEILDGKRGDKMLQIGRRIYYDKSTGNAIIDTGECSGDVIEMTIEQDFQVYVALTKRVPDTVGVLQLEYGQYAQDFHDCNGYRVDITGDTPTLVFSYPDPSAPEAPPVYQKPITTQVEELKAQNAEIIMTLVMNDLM